MLSANLSRNYKGFRRYKDVLMLLDLWQKSTERFGGILKDLGIDGIF